MLPAKNRTAPSPVVNPNNPATWLKPDEPLIGADGRDWSWCYVWFKDIPDWPGYKVGWDGEIWSCRRVCNFSGEKKWDQTDRWSRRRQMIYENGYRHVGMYRNGKQRPYKTHFFVIEAFWGPRPDGLVARHMDGDRTNSRADNLRWGTVQQNSDDRIRHGTVPLGSRHPGARLTEPEVRRILELRRAGMSGIRIAAMMGRGARTVYDILEGRTWSHLTGTVFPDAPDAVLKRHNLLPFGT